MKAEAVRVLPSPGDHLLLEADLPRLGPGDAFDHWTRPDLLTRWWPQEATVDARPGGGYHLAWPALGWHLRGTYRTFDPPSRLSFSWRWDHEPGSPERAVEVAIDPAESGSRLTLWHGRYEIPTDLVERQGHVEGWLHFLGRLGSLDPA